MSIQKLLSVDWLAVCHGLCGRVSCEVVHYYLLHYAVYTEDRQQKKTGNRTTVELVCHREPSKDDRGEIPMEKMVRQWQSGWAAITDGGEGGERNNKKEATHRKKKTPPPAPRPFGARLWYVCVCVWIYVCERMCSRPLQSWSARLKVHTPPPLQNRTRGATGDAGILLIVSSGRRQSGIKQRAGKSRDLDVAVFFLLVKQ